MVRLSYSKAKCSKSTEMRNSVISILGHDKIAELLIQNGANVNAMTIYGRTPLHWSAINGNLFYSIVIKENVNVLINNFRFADNVKIADLLLRNGGDVNVIDYNGQTALSLAISKGFSIFMKIGKKKYIF